MGEGKVYQAVKMLAGLVIGKWMERGHNIAEGENQTTVVDKIADAMFRIADADAVLLVTLEPRDDKDGVHRLRNFYFGPRCDDLVVDMLNASRKVAADLTGLAQKVNPKDLAAFLSGLHGPASALATMAVNSRKEEATIADTDTEHDVRTGEFCEPPPSGAPYKLKEIKLGDGGGDEGN